MNLNTKKQKTMENLNIISFERELSNIFFDLIDQTNPPVTIGNLEWSPSEVYCKMYSNHSIDYEINQFFNELATTGELMFYLNDKEKVRFYFDNCYSYNDQETKMELLNKNLNI